MLRKWLKEHLPKQELFKDHPRLRWLGKALHDPNLWCLNRRSTSRGVAVGFFVAFMPLPLQILLSAIGAILFRGNLPIAVALSTINNPFTFVPINYFMYRLGAWIFSGEIKKNGFTQFAWQLDSIHSAWRSLMAWLPQFGKVYFVGMIIMVVGSSVLGYFLVQLGWRIEVLIRFRRRNKRRLHK